MTLAALRVHMGYRQSVFKWNCIVVVPIVLRRKSGFCAHFDHPTIITCEKAVYVYTQLCIINHAAYVYGSNIYGGNKLAL